MFQYHLAKANSSYLSSSYYKFPLSSLYSLFHIYLPETIPPISRTPLSLFQYYLAKTNSPFLPSQYQSLTHTL